MFGVETNRHLHILDFVTHLCCLLNHSVYVACQLSKHFLHSLVALGAHLVVVHPVSAGQCEASFLGDLSGLLQAALLIECVLHINLIRHEHLPHRIRGS